MDDDLVLFSPALPSAEINRFHFKCTYPENIKYAYDFNPPPQKKILAANPFMWVQGEIAAKDCRFLYIQQEIFHSNLWSERTLRLCRYAEF